MTKHGKLDIIIEKPGWLAVNKPSGLIVEKSHYETPTLEDLVYEHLARSKKDPFVGVVHRLDRPTSGIVLYAKKKSILKLLNAQFAEKRVSKTYLAITDKEPEMRSANISHWHLKNTKLKRADLFAQQKKGSLAVSLHYKLLKTIEKRSILEIKPKTGKYHQIRAQLSEIGCPIVGDIKYGATPLENEKYIALHAWKLQIFEPQSGDKIIIKAPIPNYSVWSPFKLS